MNYIHKEATFITAKRALGRKLIINPSLRIYYFKAMGIPLKNNWSVSREN
jgi:hypothetical protein